MAYSYRERRDARGLLALDYNEYVGGFHPGLFEGFSRQTAIIRSYPSLGTSVLEAEIGRGLGLDAERVTLTNGADDGIFHALLVLSRCGVTTFAPFESPTYDHLPAFCRTLGLRRVNLGDAELVYVCTPNNPTGRVLGPEAIGNMVAAQPDRSWIIDISYADYSDCKPQHYVNALRRSPNACLVMSFGKTLPMAGARLGLIVTWNAELYDYFSGHYNRKLPNNVARHLLRDMLRHLPFYEEQRRQILRNRMKIREILLGLFRRVRSSVSVRSPLPVGGNFITFFSEKRILEEVSGLLDRARISVRYKPEHSYLRVTSCCDSYLELFERRTGTVYEALGKPIGTRLLPDGPRPGRTWPSSGPKLRDSRN